MAYKEIQESQEKVWDYLVYELLSKLEEAQPDWRSVTSSQFSKLPCIADRYLVDELKRNIEFPRYWYKYGEVGNREPLDNTLFILEEADDWGGIEVRPAKPEADFGIDPDLQSDVDEAIEFVIGNFANVNIEKVKALQYEHFAPNDFIRTFEEVRSQIYDLAEEMKEDAEIEDIEQRRSDLFGLLETLVEEYPEDTYQEMKTDFDTWVDVIHDQIEKGQFGRAEAHLEEFWEVFSKVHLRMEHNNYPYEKQIKRWEMENEFELEKYRETLKEIADA